MHMRFAIIIIKKKFERTTRILEHTLICVRSIRDQEIFGRIPPLLRFIIIVPFH